MDNYCCYLPKEKTSPLKEAKTIWETYEGHFIGIGYIFPRKYEEKLQSICAKADIHLYQLPMHGLSFEIYRDSYKLDYLRSMKQEKEGRLKTLMVQSGIQTLEELRTNKDTSEKFLTELLNEIDDLEAAIKRHEKAGVAKEAAKSELPSKHDESISIPIPYTFQNLLVDLSQTREGLKTGYESLDTLIEIPQGAITLIAGRPSHGKTITKLNLFLKMVDQYPEMNFYFFSYEEPKSQILLKLLNILSGDLIDEHQNLSNLEGYLRGGHQTRQKINDATKKLQLLTETGRLVVSDYPYFVDDFSTIVSKLKNNKAIKLGSIFVDYIQKVKIKQKHATRQMELQKISETILETAKSNNIPIVLGAQLGRGSGKKEVIRLDNLREAGDIENDAKLVLGVWNQAKEDADGKEESLKTRKVDLELVILKNRNGPSNQSVFLEFDRPLSTINEKPSQQNQKYSKGQG